MKVLKLHEITSNFKKIVQNPRVQNLPFILETPNDDDGYAAEIEKIKGWMI